MSKIIWSLRFFLADILIGDSSFIKNVLSRGDIDLLRGRASLRVSTFYGKVYSLGGELEFIGGEARIRK